MPTIKPVEADYSSCLAKVNPTADGKLHNLTVVYESSNKNFSRLRHEIIAAKASCSVHGYEYVIKEIDPKDGRYRLEATFTKHDAGNQVSILSTEMRALVRSLESWGVLNKNGAGKFIRDYCDGTNPSPSMFDPAPAAIRPAAPAVAAGGASATSALRSLYFVFSPAAASANRPLTLIFILNGSWMDSQGVPDPAVYSAYSTLLNEIQQVIQGYNNQTHGARVQPTITQATATSNIKSEFEVQLSNPHGAYLSQTELEGVADALFYAGILDGADRSRLKQTSPAPVPQALPAPALPQSAPLLNYHGCNYNIGRNRLSQKNTLKLSYELRGTLASVQHDYNKLELALKNAANRVPTNGLVRVEANVGRLTTNANYSVPGGGSVGNFDVEFERKFVGSYQNIQEPELRALATELGRSGCLSSTQVPILNNMINAAVVQSGWARTP